MDKINTHKFDLGVKNNDASKTDDVLGALFSLPVLVDEKKVNGKNMNEFIEDIQSSIFSIDFKNILILKF